MNQKTARVLRKAANTLNLNHRALKAEYNRLNGVDKQKLKQELKHVMESK